MGIEKTRAQMKLQRGRDSDTTEGTRNLDSTYHIQSVMKANQVISAFLGGEGGLTVSEVAQSCQMIQSSAYRMVMTLKACGILEEEHRSGVYRLSRGLLPLANKVLNQERLLRFARPELQSLAEKTAFNTSMAVLHGEQVLYVYRQDAPGTKYTHTMLGRLSPVYCTALGKVLICELSQEELDLILTRGMQRYTRATIETREALSEELERVAAQGYAVDHQEMNEGVCCLAAPVRHAEGQIVAAVSVSTLAAEFLSGKEEILAQTVTYHTKRISSAMGYQPHYF